MIIFTNAPTKTNNSPRIEWKSAVPASFKCSLDNALYTSCGDTLDTRGMWIGTNLLRGPHTLDIKAEDVERNEGEPRRHSWFVGKMIASKLHRCDSLSK